MTLRDSTGVDAPMVAAEGTLLPSARRLTAQTDDTEPVVVIEVRLQVGQPDLTMPMPERAADVTATVLATAPISVDEWPGKTVAAGHVTVDPGATLNFPAVPGPVLLILESGDLELTASAEWVATGVLD